ncbi:diguanylate cyclase [uncultured Methylibium sp.]|uniref:diguanylate cyclase n=1 Tax=uncultured Methylibium sp. TaxID=381093 RepID=UPI0025E0C696|nr:diguanylate cyclase [uncultured Methylibium sp.]
MQTAAGDPRIGHIERLVDAIDLPIGRWDVDHRLIFCNEPYLAWAGRTRADLLGRTLAQIYGDAAWTAAEGAFARAFGGQTVCYERLLTHRDGSPRWARIQAFPDRDPAGRVDAIYTIAFDIHDDVVARQALEATRRRLDRFTEHIPYPLTYVDRDFIVRFVNKAYVDASGMTAPDVLGQHIGQVRGARRWEEHRPWFERALAGEAAQYTRLVDLAGIGARWMRTSYVPDRDETGCVIGLYTVTIDVHELTVAQQQLQRSVERCPLTDAYSRRTMMERIEAALPAARDAPVALFFVDLDGFKAVNDTLGHREGDRLLVAAAVALQAAVRVDDAVGRIGGDEFLVLARVRDEAGAHALALHLLDAVRRSDGGLPGSHRVTASIGYALAPDDAENAARLVQRADEAMYAAKRLGRDGVLHCAARTAPVSESPRRA